MMAGRRRDATIRNHVIQGGADTEHDFSNVFGHRVPGDGLHSPAFAIRNDSFIYTPWDGLNGTVQDAMSRHNISRASFQEAAQ